MTGRLRARTAGRARRRPPLTPCSVTSGSRFSPEFSGIPLLGRLYVVHIAVLPTLFVLVIAVHLMLIKYRRMAPSPFRDSPEPEPTEPFTRHLGRLGGYGLVLLAVLIVLAVLAPPGLDHAPITGIEVTKPAWPLLWVYPIENWVGLSGILWATIFIFGALLIVPLIDRGPNRHPRQRIPMMIAAGLLVATMLGLIIYAALQPVRHPSGWLRRAYAHLGHLLGGSGSDPAQHDRCRLVAASKHGRCGRARRLGHRVRPERHARRADHLGHPTAPSPTATGTRPTTAGRTTPQSDPGALQTKSAHSTRVTHRRSVR